MQNKIVTQEDWLAARRSLLEEEKALQQARDSLAEKRRALPWVRVETDYIFDGESGEVTLAELFGDHPQLIIYHFMFHPEWQEGCPSCSFWADSYDRMVPHLKARNVAFAAVSRAPLEKLLGYRERMGWSFPWVSSVQNRFNYDYHVSFTPEQLAAGTAFYNFRAGAPVGEEMPGLSVFYREAKGAIFHTYSTYARGLDAFNPAYQYLDIVPKGRDEADFEYSMQWVRRHDEYEG